MANEKEKSKKGDIWFFLKHHISLFHILGKGYAPFARNYKIRMLIPQRVSINQFPTAKFIRSACNILSEMGNKSKARIFC